MAKVIINNLKEDAKMRFLVYSSICGAVTRHELDTFGALALHLGSRLLCLLTARHVFDMDDGDYEAEFFDRVRSLLVEAAVDLTKIQGKEGR